MSESKINNHRQQRLIFSVRLAYIVVEVFYNLSLIHFTTTISTDIDDLDKLVDVGHWLAAVGLTLLLAPIVCKRSRGAVAAVILIFSVVFVHTTISRSVDWAVTLLQDSTHEAYYLSLFRMGLAGDVIDSELIPYPGSKTMDFRLTLVNIYAAMFADEQLVEKVSQQAQPAALLVMTARNARQVEATNNHIADVLLRLDKQHGELLRYKDEIESYLAYLWRHSEEHLESIVEKQIERPYRETYLPASNSAESLIKSRINNVELINDVYRKVRRTIRYNPKRPPQSYHTRMRELFPNIKREIPLKTWCDRNGCPSKSGIKNAIKRLGREDFHKQTGVSLGLTLREFMHSQKVKNQFIVWLNKVNSANHDMDFDYSLRAYREGLAIGLRRDKAKLDVKLVTLAKNHLQLEDPAVFLNWETMIRQSPIVKDLLDQYFGPPFNNSERNIVEDMIVNRQLSFQELQDKVFLPMQTRQIAPLLYQRNDFKPTGPAKQDGEDAIISLVAPAAGVTLSLLSLLLNVASVVSYLVLNVTQKTSVAAAAWILTITLLFLPGIRQREDGSAPLLLNRLSQQVDDARWVRYHLFFVSITLHIEEALNHAHHAISTPGVIQHHDLFNDIGRL